MQSPDGGALRTKLPSSYISHTGRKNTERTHTPLKTPIIHPMMNHPLQTPPDSWNELQFTTSVDTSVQQNVPVPSQPPTLNTATLDPNSGNDETAIAKFFKNSGHPIPCIFHVLFKAAAIIFYQLGGFFQQGTNFITVTVVCIVLLALDFWVVKNVTGRLLVGLRWWAQGEGEDGMETRWIFEAAPADTYTPNKFDASWFWGVLYVTPLIWMGSFFIGLLKWNFGWLITVSFAIGSGLGNVYGYWQCSKDQKAKFQQMVAQGAQYGAGAAMRHNVFGKMASMASGFGAGPAQGQARETTFV